MFIPLVSFSLIINRRNSDFFPGKLELNGETFEIKINGGIHKPILVGFELFLDVSKKAIFEKKKDC